MFKFFALKILIVAFCLFSVSSIYGQSLVEECETIYVEFLANRKGPEIERYEKAITAGKKYLEKCGDLKDQEVVKDYVTKQLSKLGAVLNPPPHPRSNVEKFNSSVSNKNWDEAFASGKELIIKFDGHFTLDVSLVLASIGFDNAVTNPPNDKFNEEAIYYAKLALQSLNENKPSGTGNYGAFVYTYKNEKCPNGKLNATGWMNYIIGYILYVRQKQTNTAIPYLYQATQSGCETKNIAEIYRLIGNYYVEEFKKLNNSPSGNIALQRGYANRMLDAYARAYNATPQSQELLKTVALSRVREIYEVFYNSDEKGLNGYLKSVNDTPFVDPATPVSPLPKNEQ